MLHPVGPLPAAVYWRRRLLVLALLVAVLGGGGWVAVAALTGSVASSSTTPAAATTEAIPTAEEPPALARVVPSLAGVQTPRPAPRRPAAAPRPAEAGPGVPTPGGPCGDDMIGLEIRTPGSAPVGAKPTFELVVTNTSAVPCVRVLDAGLQEIVLVDGAGARVWGSNDCFPGTGSETRTLAPGESVAFPLVWGGLTSEPSCTAARTPPAPGQYALRGRLESKVSPDAPFTIG